MKKCGLHFLLILIVVGHSFGSYPLLDHLLSEYDSRELPKAEEEGQSVEVLISMVLRMVVELDAKKQVLTTSVWIRTRWQDSRLLWNPEDFNNTKKVMVPHFQLWKPDLVLYDNTDLEYRSMLQDVAMSVWHNGTISLVYPALFKSSCRFNIFYFPFDQQTCKMRFGSWTYDRSSLHYCMDGDQVADTRYYSYNSEWMLTNFTAEIHEDFQHDCCDEPMQDVTFSITLRRRSIMHFYYLYFPNILINIIATFQFLLPCDSTEKVTLGITILLAMIVYLLLMEEMLPLTEVVPIIVHYMSITLALVTMSLLITIIVLEVHHNGKHDNHSQLPHWARKYILHGLARFLCMDKYITSDIEHEIKLQAMTSHVSLVEESGDEDTPATDSPQPTKITHSNPIPEIPTIISENAESLLQKPVLPSIGVCGAKLDRAQFPSGEHDSGGGGGGGRSGRGARKHSSDGDQSLTGYSSSNWLNTQPGSHHRHKSMQIRRSDLSKNKELLLLKILKHCEDFAEKATNEEKDAELASEWQQLAMLLDRLFFYIYCCIVVIVWIIVLGSKPDYGHSGIK